jgi:L,D-peptidoglycan transpeptidase YkuD (ErfK/YbiS/YcfS/YnhG family)
LRFLVLVALLACSSSRPSGPEPEPEPEPVQQLLSDADQLVLGISSDFDSTSVTLTRHERRDGAWITVGAPIPAVLGRAGQGWGRGLHGAGAPPGRPGPTKVEGDGKAPSGAFTIVRAFGYDAAAPAGTALPYQPLDDSWRCVDDPASAHYNDVLDATGVTTDWSSAEIMRRDDELYRWVVELDHNAATGTASPGGGSCIFFHVWAGPDDTTAGCTAMAEPALADLLAWLRPGAVYVLLPRAERDALAAAWGLPD